MKGRLIAIDSLPDGRKIAALLEDGQLEDLLVDPRESAPAPEALFRARATRPMKGMGGMFVDLGGGQTGFLRETKGISTGEPLLVQISGVAERGKAAPVTMRVLFKSRYAILTPDRPGLNISRSIKDEEARLRLRDLAGEAMQNVPQSIGLILRSAAEKADDQAVLEDIEDLEGMARPVLEDTGQAPELLLDAPGAEALAWRDWPGDAQLDREEGCFGPLGIWDQIEAARTGAVPLPDGGKMYVEPTRALVAVDVNTGADTSPAAGLKANIAALRALPRALRLRGLAGQIVIDLAPFPKKERRTIEQVLTGLLRREGAETQLAGWTPLGHIELRRKRDRFALEDLL